MISKKLLWWISAVLVELKYILAVIVSSYLTIIINIVIIYGISKTNLIDILSRYDIMNSILTTTISLLISIEIFVFWKKKSHNYIPWIIYICIFAMIFSVILTIQIELRKFFFDNTLVFNAMIVIFIITIICIGKSNFNLNNVRQFVSRQEEAHNAKKIKEVTVGEKKVKI